MDNLFVALDSLKNKENFQKQIHHIISNKNFSFKNKPVTELRNFTSYFYYYSNKSKGDGFTNKSYSKNSALSESSKLSIEFVGQCRIDNLPTLLPSDELKSISVKKSDTNENEFDEAIFALLYKQYKNNLPKQLKGNFSYVLWDEESETLQAAIDPFSARSLFYMQVDNAIYIASDAKVLAKHTDITLTVNKRAVAQWLSGRPDPNISMYNEIKRLPGGHQLTWRNNQVLVSSFWDINSSQKIRYSTSEEYQAHFFQLLSNSVANRLINPSSNPSSCVFSQMSGGMDSTSITAIANIEAKKQNQVLHTLSHSYKNTESCNEMDNINDMIKKLDLSHSHFIELDKFDDINFGELYPTDFDNPGIVLSPKYDEELALIQSCGATTLLTGNGGDEICWGHSSTYRSRLYKGELGVIKEVVDACAELNEPVASSLVKLFVKPLIPNSLQNLIRFALNKPRVNESDIPTSAWLTNESISLLEDNSFNNPFSKTFQPAKHARYHSLKTTSTYNSMRSYQKVANNYGIDVRHPFFDPEVVQFSFAIPEKMLIQGSYPKWLLRKTMENYLPESVVWNKHKTVFDHHFANLVRSNEEELRKLLSHSGLHDLGLLNNDVLLAEFDELVRNKNRHLNVDMLYAILTQLWYQTHCVD